MKLFLALGALTCALLTTTGCASKILQLGRIWPDGASVSIKKPLVQVGMTGSGTFTAEEISWVGTNGYPLTTVTNSGTTSEILAPATYRRR